MDDTFQQIVPLISITTGLESDEITPASDFKKDLSLDSLDAVELALSLEEEFGIEIDRDDIPSLVTVGDLVSYIESRM